MDQGLCAGGGPSEAAGQGSAPDGEADGVEGDQAGAFERGQGGASERGQGSVVGGDDAAVEHPPRSSAPATDFSSNLGMEGEPPKKRTKTSKTAHSSIVPCEDGAPTRMCFPPSQCLEIKETTTKKRRKHVNSKSGGPKRSKTDSIEKIALVMIMAKAKKREIVEKIPLVPLDSRTMGTRSRKFNPPNPAMSTRSKRRPSL